MAQCANKVSSCLAHHLSFDKVVSQTSKPQNNYIIVDPQSERVGFGYYKKAGCCCSRLRQKVAHIKISPTKINKAIQYAKDYHGKQLRQTGEPYYTHPIEVACMAADYVPKENILVAALLHDTLEDTVLTKDCIAVVFGESVANKVYALTRIRNGVKLPSSELLTLLLEEDSQSNKDLLAVKLCDRLHNLRTLHVKKPEKIAKIVNETKQHFVPIAEYLGLDRIKRGMLFYC